MGYTVAKEGEMRNFGHFLERAEQFYTQNALKMENASKMQT